MTNARSPNNDLAAAFIKEASKDASTFVSNANVKISSIKIAEHLMPITVTAPGPTQTWTVSLRSAYGPYALTEIDHAPFPAARPILKALVKSMDWALTHSGLDNLVCVNNWLLSTNLYPDWDGTGLEKATMDLVAYYSESFLAFRSLNSAHHSSLLKKFLACGWVLLPSRRVWVVEPDTPYTRDRANDDRLLAKTSMIKAEGHEFDDTDWSRAADLYAQLYLDKYSGLNPVFAPHFLKWSQNVGLMDIRGLRNDSGVLLSIVGTISEGRVMATPLIGYDMSAPQKLGLYRMSTAMAFEVMTERNLCFNLSAGVGGFKRNRGANPIIEYTALYHRHLSPWRGIAPNVLRGMLSRIGVPVMERFDL